MQIKARQMGSVVVLDCSGKLTLGESTLGLRNAVQEQLMKGTKNLLLNVALVNSIDGSGLGELVSLYITMTKQSGNFKILNPTKKIQELLQITKLLTVFRAFDNEQIAIASF